jgi:hypothetical protein
MTTSLLPTNIYTVAIGDNRNEAEICVATDFTHAGSFVTLSYRTEFFGSTKLTKLVLELSSIRALAAALAPLRLDI